MKVLILDTCEFDRLMTKLLISRQMEVATIAESSSTQEAITKLNQQQFDIVILGYQDSLEKDIEILVKLQRATHDTSTAFIVSCNNIDDNFALKCLKAGAQDFLLKTEITPIRLRYAILHAQLKFELTNQIYTQKQAQIREASMGTQAIEKSGRFVFNQALRERLQSENCQQKLALLLMDLDNFKYINDAYGHEFGDKILRKVALRLRGNLKNGDLMARFGGDEFAVLIARVDIKESIQKIAKRLLNTLSKPLYLDKISVQLSASIGISIYPDDGANQSELLKRADIAMYQAKASGNHCCFFQTEMEQGITQRMYVDNALRKNGLTDNLLLNFQPVVNPHSKEILGFEALLRWRNNGNVYMPDDFIFIAEENGQIQTIGRWVIEFSLAQLAKWNRNSSKSFTMAINISPAQLIDPLLLNCLTTSLRLNDIDPSLVEVELTETALLGNSPEIVETVLQIHELGCRIALDDFGTGYSSISHLQSFPIDIVKIDKSIMPKSVRDIKNQALIHGLTIMSNILGINVIAEGVESKEQADACLLFGINKVQGYYFYKPLSIQKIEELIYCQ